MIPSGRCSICLVAIAVSASSNRYSPSLHVSWQVATQCAVDVNMECVGTPGNAPYKNPRWWIHPRSYTRQVVKWSIPRFVVLRECDQIMHIAIFTHSHLQLQPKGPGLGHTHDSHSALVWGSNALRHMWYIIGFTKWSFGTWFMLNFRVQSPSVQISWLIQNAKKLYKTPRCGMVFGMSGCTTKASQTSCLLHKLFELQRNTFHPLLHPL